MVTQLNGEWMTFRFPLIWFAKLDYRLFLRSDNPEEIILSILADFDGELPEQALQQILYRIEETTDTTFALQRHINQLRVLAQLRNLGIKLKEAMDSIAQYIDEEKSAFYLSGLDKGEA